MRFLVSTNGFVGSYLVNALAQDGHTVIAVYLQEPPLIEQAHKERVTLVRADIIHDDLECEKVETVIHASSLEPDRFVKQNVRDFISANVNTTVNLAEYARRSRVKTFIYLSDTAVYGKHCVGTMTEDSPIHPESVYAMSKHFAETVLTHYQGYFVPLIVRTPPILGHGVFKSWLGDIMTQFKFNEDLYVYNAQALYNNIIDIYELYRFILHVSARGDLVAGTVNFAADEPLKIEALVRHVATQAGSISKLVKQDEKSESQIMAIDKLKTVYGFTPKTVKEIAGRYFQENS
jgi:nucleoside-diphosphate-sugar epimerase